MVGCYWRSLAEALDSESHPPPSVWAPVKREGFLYSTRQECYYLHSWWNAASGRFWFLSSSVFFYDLTILHYAFVSFIVLILPSQRDFDCLICFCCYIWNWLETALSEFVTLFSETVLNILFCPCMLFDSKLLQSIKQEPVFHYNFTIFLAHVLKEDFDFPQETEKKAHEHFDM